MTEKQLCTFVERWNEQIEEYWPWEYTRLAEMLDDLMATHDASQDEEIDSICGEYHLACLDYLTWTFVADRAKIGEDFSAALRRLLSQRFTDAPQWVEASAMADDGTIYWTRERESGPDACVKAQERADYLAQCRCKDSR